MPKRDNDPASLSDCEPCDHEWEFVDASFDHQFGTEHVWYDECSKCGATRDHEPSYFEELYGD